MKYHINFNRKKLSPEEMNKHMNFDQFISNVPAKGSFFKAAKALKWAAASGAAIITAVAAYLYLNKQNDIPGQRPFIDPLLAEVNIKPSVFSIDPSRDTTLVFETGSSIVIPSHIFADKSGNPVDGNVELRYREFHDPAEILLSGIPMHYDSAGTHYTFESAGMFEVLAFKNGKPLKIVPGKEITVNMMSMNADDFNMYYLDTAKQQWSYIGTSSVLNGNSKVLFDSVMHKEYAEKMAGVSEPPAITVADPNKQNFMIDYNKEEFPELAVFDGVKFQVDANDHSYDPHLADKVWEDVAVKRVDKRYTVTFSREKSSYTFDVVPVVEEQNHAKAKKELDRKMAEYVIALNSRKDKENDREKILQANYEKYVSEAKWQNVNARLTEMIKRNPINYTSLALRTFGISSLGIYNSDMPRTFFSEPRFATVKLFNKEKEVNAYNLCMLIKGHNMAYRFNCNGNTARIEFGKDDENFLVATTSDGKLAYIDAKEFKRSIGPGEVAQLQVKVHEKKIESVEEFRTLVDMK
jgi:hypothetical protein